MCACTDAVLLISCKRSDGAHLQWWLARLQWCDEHVVIHVHLKLHTVDCLSPPGQVLEQLQLPEDTRRLLFITDNTDRWVWLGLHTCRLLAGSHNQLRPSSLSCLHCSLPWGGRSRTRPVAGVGPPVAHRPCAHDTGDGLQQSPGLAPRP